MSVSPTWPDPCHDMEETDHDWGHNNFSSWCSDFIPSTSTSFWQGKYILKYSIWQKRLSFKSLEWTTSPLSNYNFESYSAGYRIHFILFYVFFSVRILEFYFLLNHRHNFRVIIIRCAIYGKMVQMALCSFQLCHPHQGAHINHHTMWSK